ncbi:hypothetical protein GALL_547540 [mine drainage metagenome]|uniref:Uncharacterized protein n=1 Tax=mine drainage metagenome TaxID=410659 RepID=A0A1J5NZN0_9ZZZZ
MRDISIDVLCTLDLLLRLMNLCLAYTGLLLSCTAGYWEHTMVRYSRDNWTTAWMSLFSGSTAGPQLPEAYCSTGCFNKQLSRSR